MSVSLGQKLLLTSGGTYTVTHVFTPTRAVVSYDGGLAVIVDAAPDGSWDLSGQPASPDEQVVVQNLMPAQDSSQVDIVKDS